MDPIMIRRSSNIFPVLVFLPVFLSLTATAQNYPVNLDNVTVKCELQGYFVERVINASREDSVIGYVQKGVSNRVVPAVLRPSIGEAVGDLLKRSLPPGPGLKPLIIRINRLYIYEITYTTSEIGCIQLSINIIGREDSSCSDKFMAGVTFARHAGDVTHLHPENIANALGICLDDFSRRQGRGLVKDRPIPANEISSDPLIPVTQFAAFHQGVGQPAVYHTFYDFRDGYPDLNFPYTVTLAKDKDTTIHRATLTGGEKGAATKIWGFTDGLYTYVNAGKIFYRLKKTDKGFTTWIYDRDIKEEEIAGNIALNTAMATYFGGIFIGGLVGGLGALAAGTSKEGAGYQVDFYTGSLTPQDLPDYLKLFSTLIFYVEGASPGVEVRVSYKGKEICRCRSGDYIRMELPSRYRTFSLTFATPDGPVTTQVITARLFNTDTYHVRVKKDKEIIVNPVFEELKKNILRSMTDERTHVLQTLD